VDPGIKVGGGRGTVSEAGGLGAALRPPVCPGRSPGGGPGGQAPGSSWVSEILQALKHVFQESILKYFCHLKWSKIDKKKIPKFNTFWTEISVFVIKVTIY
jgi:hypothetical protein